MCVWVVYIFKPLDQGLYFLKIVVNAAGDITGVEAVTTVTACVTGIDNEIFAALAGIINNTAACAAGINDKTPAILTGIACDVITCAVDVGDKTFIVLAGIVCDAAAYAAGIDNKIPAVLAGIVYNILGAVMAGSGLNYRLIYVCSGRANA